MVSKKNILKITLATGLIISSLFTVFALGMFDIETIKDVKHNLDRLSMLDKVLKVKQDQVIFLIDRLKVDNSTVDINRLSEIIEFFNNLETTIEDFDLTTENKTVIKELFEESKSEAR
jgi:hypothetical protein